MRRVASSMAVVAVVALGLYPAATVSAATRTSFTQVEGDVMCVVCHEPLAVAQSPEAFQERDYIRGLILQGKTRRQIENDLVQQYGPAVLAKPPAHGFNLVVWVVPPVAIVIAIVTLAFTLPRWRRRTRQAATATDGARHDPAGRALTDADTRRLDEDLARDF
jgi:cytochrome c-type biogenesis protein CcmH